MSDIKEVIEKVTGSSVNVGCIKVSLKILQEAQLFKILLIS